MRNLTAALLMFAAVAASTSCGRGATGDERTGAAETKSPATGSGWSVVVQPTVSPSGPNSSELQPTASDRGVILSWIERAGNTTTLKFAEQTASGWTNPAVVASGDDWFVSYADPPSVMRLSDGTLVAQREKQTDPLLEATDPRDMRG